MEVCQNNFNGFCKSVAIFLTLGPLLICTAGLVFFALFYV